MLLKGAGRSSTLICRQPCRGQPMPMFVHPRAFMRVELVLFRGMLLPALSSMVNPTT
jgi:hypothetical protein